MSTETGVRRFTATYIAGLKAGATRRDISDPVVPGLVLRLGTTGCKSWLLRFKWDGAATRISLGTFPALGLAEARQRALKNREWIDRGIDPRRAVDRNTRRACHRTLVVLPKGATPEVGTKPGDTEDFLKRLKALETHARGSHFVLPGKDAGRPANPKLITRGVKRLLPRFRARQIEPFTPHDLRRTGGRRWRVSRVTPFIAERSSITAKVFCRRRTISGITSRRSATL
jgi:hypothetical protein